MKKLTVVFVLVLGFGSQVFAQQDSLKAKTLLGGKVKQLGLLVSTEGQFSGLNGGFRPSSGASATLLINQKLGIGLAGYGIGSLNETVGQINTEAAYGGLQLEYTPKPMSVFHVSFPLLIGGGMARLDTVGVSSGSRGRGFDGGGKGKGGKNDKYDAADSGYDGKSSFNRGATFGFIQPGVRAEVNLFKYAKLFAGVNYRIALNSSSTTLTNSKLSGFGVQGGLKFGFFDFNLRKH